MIAFAILLIVFLEIGFTQRPYVYAILGFGGYFLINEFIAILVNHIGYFLDFWNYIDLARITLIFVYSIIKLEKLT